MKLKKIFVKKVFIIFFIFKIKHNINNKIIYKIFIRKMIYFDLK